VISKSNHQNANWHLLKHMKDILKRKAGADAAAVIIMAVIRLLVFIVLCSLAARYLVIAVHVHYRYDMFRVH